MFQGLLAAAAAAVLLLCGCSPKQPKLTVGSKASKESSILAEVIAQHLETRGLGTIIRKSTVGGSALAYQALMVNEIDLYPEDTGAVMGAILKEIPDARQSVVIERVRGELERISRVQFIGPLNVENPFAVVMLASEAKKRKLATVSDAAAIGQPGWEFASPPEFQERHDGNTSLQSAYRINVKAAARILEPDAIYKALTDRQADLAVGTETDGALYHGDFVVLKDDKHAFIRSQLGVLTRQDVLNSRPNLRALIMELDGKLSAASVRRMNFEVETQHRPVKDVAADFLAGRLN